jgi:GTPase SAR1 family protein
MGNEQGKSSFRGIPEGIATMDQKLQEKFAKGIHFNMKVVIRGERNSGKTALFQRLQGGKFLEAYIPTEEIQVGTIVWGYKGTNDKVKVEIWDVVDKGKPKKQSAFNLKGFQKTAPATTQDEALPLDASFLDVYKNTHGVIFTFDICKKWTWQYIERELPLVPYHIPIIIIGNFRDMEDHRTMTTDQAQGFIEYLERPEGSASVRYCESSMKDCFGLAYLHKFFSIPFLQMQQEALLQQLQENRLQTQLTLDELEYNPESTDFNYAKYTEMLQKRTSQRQEQVPSPPQQSDTPPTKSREERSKIEKPLTSRELPAGKTHSGIAPVKVTKRSQVLDDFIPEDKLEDDFLNDDLEQNEDSGKSEESDSDGEQNPLVAADEDLDSEDSVDVPHPTTSITPPTTSKKVSRPQEPPKMKLKQVKDIQLTESESEKSEPEENEVKGIQTKISTSGDFSFETPITSTAILQPTTARSHTKKSGGSSGLLLAFGTDEVVEQGEEEMERSEDAHETHQKGKKKKKASKKQKQESQHKEKKEEPLLPVDSLDAWLGEPDEDAGKDGAPVKKTRKKTTKEGTSKKKKKSKKTTTLMDGDEPGGYDQL